MYGCRFRHDRFLGETESEVQPLGLLGLFGGGGRLDFGQLVGRGRRGLQRDVARPPERNQHPIQLLLSGLDAAGLHEPLADQPADQLDLGRGVQHVGQQPPGQRAAAVQLAGRGRAELVELGLGPILLVAPPGGHLLFQRLFRPQQARVFRVLGDLIVLFPPAGDLHVVLVGQHEDVSLLVELGPARPAENLVRRARIEQLLLVRRAFHDARHDDRAGRQVDARRKRLGADRHGEQLPLKEFFDHAAVLGQHAGMVYAHAAHQQLLELRPGPFRPVVAFQLGRRAASVGRRRGRVCPSVARRRSNILRG